MASFETVYEITELLEHICVSDNAARAMTQLEACLGANGYSVEREFVVPDGRIDMMIVATDGTKVAIEVDRCSPRKRSINKLSQLDDDIGRLILLRRKPRSRNKQTPKDVVGVDAVMFLDGSGSVHFSGSPRTPLPPYVSLSR